MAAFHTYAKSTGATKVLPGQVFWNDQSEGWSFNVLIDGITVRSNNRYPRECIAREALRLEVDSIHAMLAARKTKSPDSKASVITTTDHNDDDEEYYASDVSSSDA